MREKYVFFLDGKKLTEAILTTSFSEPIDFTKNPTLNRKPKTFLETGGEVYRVWPYFSFDKKGRCKVLCYTKKPKQNMVQE